MHLLVAHMASCIYVNLVNMKFGVLVPSSHDCRMVAISHVCMLKSTIGV